MILKRNFFLNFFCLGIVAAGLISVSIAPRVVYAQSQEVCAADRLDLRTAQGEVQFQVELADTPNQRSRGLMFRPEMAEDAGMLFIYDRPAQAVFWMKNTLIGLDLIFADSLGRVTHVHPNAIPHDETPIYGGDNIQYILEINAGLAERLGITPGTVLRHPRLAAGAIWSCS